MTKLVNVLYVVSLRGFRHRYDGFEEHAKTVIDRDVQENGGRLILLSHDELVLTI